MAQPRSGIELSAHFIISPPIPSSELLLCRSATHLAVSGLRASTIKCYLSAIKQLHIARGVGDPGIGNMAKLEQVLKGIKSAQAKGGDTIQPRLPITPASNEGGMGT